MKLARAAYSILPSGPIDNASRNVRFKRRRSTSFMELMIFVVGL